MEGIEVGQVEIEERDGVVIFKRNGHAFAEYVRTTQAWSLLPHGTAEALLAWQAERDELRARVAEVEAERDKQAVAVGEVEALLTRLRCPGPVNGTLAERVRAVINWTRKIRDGEWSPADAMSYGIDPDALAERDALRARVAEVEAARLWVMEGLRSSEVRVGEPTDAEMEAAGAVDKRLLTAGEVNDLCRDAESLRARVAELEAAARWIPLTEQLPPQDGNTDVEVASFRLPECPSGAIALLDAKGEWIPEHGPLDFTPTHWRALGPSYEAIRAQADEDGVWRPTASLTGLTQPVPTPVEAPPAPPSRVWQVVGYLNHPLHGEGRTAREAVMWALADTTIEEEVMEEATFRPVTFEARPWLDDETLGDAETVLLEAVASESVAWAPAREVPHG